MRIFFFYQTIFYMGGRGIVYFVWRESTYFGDLVQSYTKFLNLPLQSFLLFFSFWNEIAAKEGDIFGFPGHGWKCCSCILTWSLYLCFLDFFSFCMKSLVCHNIDYTFCLAYSFSKETSCLDRATQHTSLLIVRFLVKLLNWKCSQPLLVTLSVNGCAWNHC